MDYEYRSLPARSNVTTYSAFGPSYVSEYNYETRRPHAEIDVSFKPEKFSPTFANDQEENIRDPQNITGFSEDHLRTLHRNLYRKLDPPKEESTHATHHDREAWKVLNAVHKKSSNAAELLKTAVDSGNPHFYSDKLFEHQPSTIVIGNMAADPSMRTSALTLAAIAKRQHGAQQIEASDDLSKYSSRLTRNAVSRGLPVVMSPMNTTAQVTNDTRLRERNVGISSINEHTFGELVHPDVVKEAKQDIKQMLRSGKKVRNAVPVTPKGLSDQFLPGMEGFV